MLNKKYSLLCCLYPSFLELLLERFKSRPGWFSGWRRGDCLAFEWVFRMKYALAPLFPPSAFNEVRLCSLQLGGSPSPRKQQECCECPPKNCPNPNPYKKITCPPWHELWRSITSSRTSPRVTFGGIGSCVSSSWGGGNISYRCRHPPWRRL